MATTTMRSMTRVRMGWAGAALWLVCAAATGQSTPSTLTVSPLELNNGAGATTFTVSVEPVLETAFTIAYTTADLTTVAGTDYIAATGSLSFAAFQPSASVVITILNTQQRTGNKMFSLALTPSTADVTPLNATVTIKSLTSVFFDDFEKTTSIKWDISGPWSRDESNTCVTPSSNSPSHAMVFSGPDCAYPDNAVGYLTMKYDVTLPLAAASAALSWYDYVNTEEHYDFYSVDLSFDGGVTWDCHLLKSSKNEPFWDAESLDLTEYLGKTFRVRFGFTSDRDMSEKGWFIDDVDISSEGLPVGISGLTVADPPAMSETGGPNMTFTIVASPAPSTAITVNYQTVDGTARFGVDYVAKSGSVILDATTTSVSVNVPLIDNGLTEDEQSFYLDIATEAASAKVIRGRATGAILSNNTQNCSGVDTLESEANFPNNWITTGLCYLAANSTCLGATPGYSSATHAVAFNNFNTNGKCEFYDTANKFGLLESKNNISISPAALSAKLTFQYNYDATSNERADVYISGDGGISWTQLGRIVATAPGWTQQEIPVDSYIGNSTVRLRFTFQAFNTTYNDGAGLYLDDIGICTTTLPSGYSKLSIAADPRDEGNPGDGNETYNFAVSLEPAYSSAIEVHYKTVFLESANAATPDNDYESVGSGSVPIPAGVTSVNLPVTIIEDTDIENDEVFEVVIDDVLTGVPPVPAQKIFVQVGEATGTLVNDDRPYTLALVPPANNRVDEGVDANAKVTIKLLKPDTQELAALTQSTQVSYTTTPGTAFPGTRYTPTSGTHVFDKGTTPTFDVLIPIIDNTYADPMETFTFTATSEDGISASTDINIYDTDSGTFTYQVTKAGNQDVTITEGSSPFSSAALAKHIVAQGNISFSVTPQAPFEITLGYGFKDGTAYDGKSYEGAFGQFTIPAYTTTYSIAAQDLFAIPSMFNRPVLMRPYGDHVQESNVNFQIYLTPRTANVGAHAAHKVTIRDDDFPSGATYEYLWSGANSNYRWGSVNNTATNSIVTGLSGAQITSGDFSGFAFDYFYAAKTGDNTIVKIETATGTIPATPFIASATKIVPKDLAWDHSSGRMYVCVEDSNVSPAGDKLWFIDNFTSISPAPQYNKLTDAVMAHDNAASPLFNGRILSIAVHPSSGRIYGLLREYAATPTTYQQATLVEIAATGAPVSGSQKQLRIPISATSGSGTAINISSSIQKNQMDFDDATGKLYLSLETNMNNSSGEIDLFEYSPQENTLRNVRSMSNGYSVIAMMSPPLPEGVWWTGNTQYSGETPGGTHLMASSALSGTSVGKTVTGAGDFNGDGYEDFLVAAPDALSGAGKVYLFYGEVGGLDNTSLVFDDTYFDGNKGAVLQGNYIGEHLGTDVSGVGDFNGDGYDDILLGFRGANVFGAYLLFGTQTLAGNGKVIMSPDTVGDIGFGKPVGGVRIHGVASGSNQLCSVSSIGDFCVNGFDGFAIGIGEGADGDAGNAAYLIFGAENGLGSNGDLALSVTSVKAPIGIVVKGTATNVHFGAAVAGIGDINGDGVSDVAVGAPLAEVAGKDDAGLDATWTGAGQTVVLLGHSDYGKANYAPQVVDLASLSTLGAGDNGALPLLAFTTVIPPFDQHLRELYSPTISMPGNVVQGNVPGLIVNHDKLTDANGGAIVSGAGDFNGDGLGDFAIGAPGANSVTLVFGSPTLPTELFASKIGDSAAGVQLAGTSAMSGGFSLASAGDINGDGLDDLLIGAKNGSPEFFAGAGMVYTVFGNDSLSGLYPLQDMNTVVNFEGLFVYNTGLDARNATTYSVTKGFGVSCAPLGDINRDGICDFIAGETDGATLIFGGNTNNQAIYQGFMPSGKDPSTSSVSTTKGGEDSGEEKTSPTASLDKTVTAGPGWSGVRSFHVPAGRAVVSFAGGGSGGDLLSKSALSVTLFRMPAPDPGTYWTPANVYWKMETDRAQFSHSTMDLYYTSDDVAGLNMDKVGVFHLKSNQAPSIDSEWLPVPYTNVKDRAWNPRTGQIEETGHGYFRVDRDHSTPDTANAEFNQYYAILEARQEYELGEEILPPVGLSPDDMFSQGPEVVPSQAAFWHSGTKKLYAIWTEAPGYKTSDPRTSIVVRWKDTNGEVVSEIPAYTTWPKDPNKYQTHIAGTPDVDLLGGSAFKYSNLTCAEGSIENVSDLETQVSNEYSFQATLDPNYPPTDPNWPTDANGNLEPVTGRCCIMLGTDESATDGAIYFQFVKTYNWDDYRELLDQVPVDVGIDITYPPAGTQYDQLRSILHDFHTSDTGPFVYFSDARYLPDGARYSGYYDRDARTGPIIPVNKAPANSDNMVVVMYADGQQLYSAARQEIVSKLDDNTTAVIQWPHKSVRYAVSWPANAPKIILAQQKGTDVLSSDKYGEAVDIYYQNDQNQPGFNPNEEHAVGPVTLGNGQAVYAFRCDLNRKPGVTAGDFPADADGFTSQPYVILTYTSPFSGRRTATVYEIVATQDPFVFHDWVGYYGGDDPYEVMVASPVLAPKPVNINSYTSKYMGSTPPPALFTDRSGNDWARAAGETVYTSPDSNPCDNLEYKLDTGTTVLTDNASWPAITDSPDNVGGYILFIHGHSFGIAAHTATTLTVYGDATQSGLVPPQWAYEIQKRAEIGMHYWYLVPDGVGFYFPTWYTQYKVGDKVPWLDVQAGTYTGSTPTPIDIVFSSFWPETAPEMEIGDILVEAKNGLPEINGQCSVDIIYQAVCPTCPYPDPPDDHTAACCSKQEAILIDPVQERVYAIPQSITMSNLLAGINYKGDMNDTTFPDLEPTLYLRVSLDQMAYKIKFKGILVQPTTGNSYVLLNVMSPEERDALKALAPSSNTVWSTIIDNAAHDTGLYSKAKDPVRITNSATDLYDMLALSTGYADGTGYVTLALQNSTLCTPAPITLQVIKVVDELNPGAVTMVKPACALDVKLTMRHIGDFAGDPSKYVFEWRYISASEPLPTPIDALNDEYWRNHGTLFEPTIPAGDPSHGASDPRLGENEVTITDSDMARALGDYWYVCRYRYAGSTTGLPSCYNNWSAWTVPMLAEGWVKRVVGEINPYDQRARGGAIEGVEDAFATYKNATVNTIVDMISQAGPRAEGAVALNCDALDAHGLIEIYETVFNTAFNYVDLQDAGVDQALLLISSRLSDLYMLLGNEAYADAEDPTVAFDTNDGQFGTQASSVFCFMNQATNLLDEELCLLRGRDDSYVQGVTTPPVYNRLFWNFTNGVDAGETAYALNYNIRDQFDNIDGAINESDAKALYPQGHGDAWGHYLTAMQRYYRLLHKPTYDWQTSSEALVVGGTPVSVDYRDERNFAEAAAAKARSGVEVLDLTYRNSYVEDPSRQWRGYKDPSPERAWGVAEWGERAGLGAYIDWAVGNSLLPASTAEAAQSKHAKKVSYEKSGTQYMLTLIASPQDGGTTLPEPDSVSYPANTPIAISALHYDGWVFQEWQADGVAIADVHTSSIQVSLTQNATITAVFAEETLPRISEINRGTVPELQEIAAIGSQIQSKLDQADSGLNPLGLGTNVVPFDIDPSQLDAGMTHFDQIYSRASTALDNALTTFNRAADSTQMLRRQADDAASYQRQASEQEIDYTNQLIEIYGYPYSDDIGPGETYPTGYDGPDLVHFMYSDETKITGEPFAPAGAVACTLYNSKMSIKYVPFKDMPVQHPNDFGAPEKLWNTTTEEGWAELAQTPITVSFLISTSGSRFGFQKPSDWTGERKAPGKIQQNRSSLLQAYARFQRALNDYKSYIASLNNQKTLVEVQYGVNEKAISLMDKEKKYATALDVFMGLTKAAILTSDFLADLSSKLADAAQESVPKNVGMVVGLADGPVVDVAAPARGVIKGLGTTTGWAICKGIAQVSEEVLYAMELAKEEHAFELQIDLTGYQGNAALEKELIQLQNMVNQEISQRLVLYEAYEALNQANDAYLAAVAEGDRLMAERTRFRLYTAADVQDYRYKDMAFRIFRNDALSKYRDQFDLAAKYVYLAAKAYDYETVALSDAPVNGQNFLTNIVAQRALGTFDSGAPQPGLGLADVMYRMSANFETQRGQYGFNNPQIETNRFSLRRELYRIGMGDSGDEVWRQTLQNAIVDDIWSEPEVSRFCVPPAGLDSGTPEPGIVLYFKSYVEEGLNFFGNRLGGYDSSYDSTKFATKIRSVGVWFSNYDNRYSAGLSNTPRVYLVPAGLDTLRSPTNFEGVPRTFNVLDQIMPMPFPIDTTQLSDPSYIPSLDSTGAPLLNIRRYGRFRAYHDSGQFDPSEVFRDSRLVGRSVWNSNWMLVIPQSALYIPDTGETPDAGLQKFIGSMDDPGVSDILLFFETYAHSRLKSAGKAEGAGPAKEEGAAVK